VSTKSVPGGFRGFREGASFPRDQVINLSFWDHNDVAPGYFAAAEIAAREKKVGAIADQGNVWLTGGTEADVIAEARSAEAT
jgi:hypothetical protein